jgi:hypothetical protein
MKARFLLFSLLATLLLSAAKPSQAVGQPLYLTTMTHMEQNFVDDRDQAVFNLHIQQLGYGMDLADKYGAILTIESEKPFARANSIWGRNVMAEIVARGHGVGTHCDIGYGRGKINTGLTVEKFAAQMTENKSLVDALVGAENNLGCSGAGSQTDYILAATQAGFGYINGIVALHYLPMPLGSKVISGHPSSP